MPKYTVLPCLQNADVLEYYEMGKAIGQGRFGTTYLCTYRGSDNQFACRSFPKSKLLCRDDYDNVRREMDIINHMAEHPMVVKYHANFEDLEIVHLIIDLCSGGDLFDRIIKKRHYSEREAAKLIKTIVQLVEACHALGVMHRGVRPENFLFDTPSDDAVLKAPDFGYSVFYNPGQVFQDVVGSPYFVAPEMLAKNYGPEADVWSAGVMLYMMLSGVPPFWAETESGIFRQISDGKIDLESEPWPNISECAKDLICKMLEKDPKKRLSAYGVLCHLWLVDCRVAPDRQLDSAVLSRLKQFSAMNKLKKMAVRVIAERMSEEQIGGLKELFKMIDTDNSGTITFEELKEGLKKVGSELVESEIKSLMDAADIDNSRTIDYGAFLAAALHLKKRERAENLFAAFSSFDKDGSGNITVDELQQACREFGLDDVILDEIVKETEQDNDGRIDYGEFAAMLRRV